MISYSQTVNELFDLQKYAIKLGLNNISALSDKFGNPHLKYPTIHIAGTNGKGSTAFYTSKILHTTGLKIGLFTSPHLMDFRERIRINEQLIEQDYIIDFWQDVKEMVCKREATFFDTTTLLAFKYFADKKVDLAIIETGLGGRLDSTNIVLPDIAVLTPIGYDHQKQLGKSLEKIAEEKAGIIKKNSTIIISHQTHTVLKIFKSKMEASNNLLYLPDLFKTKIRQLNINGLEFDLEDIKLKKIKTLQTPLPVEYQAGNISLSLLAAQCYTEKIGIKLDMDKVIKKISLSIWPGRMQLIRKDPNVFFDVSHNLDGIKATITSLFKFLNPLRTDLLLGIVNDKDARAIVAFLAGKFRRVIVAEPDTERKQDGNFLNELFKEQGQSVKFVKDLKAAYDESLNHLEKEDTLIALGSHYLIGAIMKYQSS